jgi:hypothetical protein
LTPEVIVSPTSDAKLRTIVRNERKRTMLIAFAVFVAAAAAARAAWSLRNLWRSLPRSNRDFGLV